MTGEANIWAPRRLISISGDTKSVEERIVAEAGQTLFTLTDFTYAVGTGALEVHRNGLLLSKGVDWHEQTESTFSLVTPATAGMVIIATGKVGITGDVDVRDTDIFLLNIQSLRDYAGIETSIYVTGSVSRGDGGQSFYHKFTGAAPGTYVDDGLNIIVPTGGNGSEGWVRAYEKTLSVADYTELAALPVAALKPNTTVMVTDEHIAGKFILRYSVAHGLSSITGVRTVISANWYAERDFSGDVMVRWFDLVADGVTDDAVAFNRAANYAATQKKWLDLQGATILHSGAYSVTGAGKYVMWKNGNLTLGPGAKTSGMFVIDAVDAVVMENLYMDGNRANVSGNNAGFWVVSNVRLAKFWDITMEDLRRYGINCYLNCDAVDIKNITGINIGVSGAALGEAIKIEDSGNVIIDNFKCTNPSGTGGGQVAKVFHCKNVKLSNFDITDPDPAKVYPGISMVRNENVVYNNIRIVGDTQVAIEDNANFSVSYTNIITEGTDKALIVGTDGAGRGDRRAKKVIINNWEDTSTVALAFNILGVLDLTINNLTTPQTLNISRDDPGTNRRTENLEMNNVSCNILNTLLVNGRKTYNRVNVTGLWTNSGPGVTEFIRSSYGSYSNGGLTDVFLARWNFENTAINIYGTMTASGGTLVYRAPDTVNNSPFHGEVLGSCLYAPALNTQWSQIRWTFYDAGTPTVNKAVIHSGATPRTNVNLVVAASTRLLTFTNTEGVDIHMTATVNLINRNDATVT